MIPFRHTDERVWYALRVLHAERRDAREYVAYVDPAGWAAMRREAIAGPPTTGWDGVAWRLFGMPIEVDPRLPRGRVVLRHEVEA